MAGEVAADADQPLPAPNDGQPHNEVAKVGDGESLIAALVGDQWIRLMPGAPLWTGSRCFVHRRFEVHSRLTGGEVTLDRSQSSRMGVRRERWSRQLVA